MRSLIAFAELRTLAERDAPCSFCRSCEQTEHLGLAKYPSQKQRATGLRPRKPRKLRPACFVEMGRFGRPPRRVKLMGTDAGLAGCQGRKGVHGLNAWRVAPTIARLRLTCLARSVISTAPRVVRLRPSARYT